MGIHLINNFSFMKTNVELDNLLKLRNKAQSGIVVVGTVVSEHAVPLTTDSHVKQNRLKQL